MAAILVVDDDDLVRYLVSTLLQRDGYEILQASNGLEALMVYSSYRARLDLVLTDIDMPQMNGLELTDRIRARDPNARILLMSGRAYDFPEGYKDVPLLPKPFRPDQLAAAVDEVLR
jgi:two-component system, cell cycle sensor histidine kinase and response regulator CckA